MLLQKSCHDLDIIADLIDLPCERVSSYGGLKYFNEAHAPQGAPEYCVQGCPVADKCPYYAPKVYGNPRTAGPTTRASRASTTASLLEGLGDESLRAVRLPDGQRRGGPSGRRDGVRGRRHSHLHHDRLHPLSGPRSCASTAPKATWRRGSASGRWMCGSFGKATDTRTSKLPETEGRAWGGGRRSDASPHRGGPDGRSLFGYDLHLRLAPEPRHRLRRRTFTPNGQARRAGHSRRANPAVRGLSIRRVAVLGLPNRPLAGGFSLRKASRGG